MKLISVRKTYAALVSYWYVTNCHKLIISILQARSPHGFSRDLCLESHKDKIQLPTSLGSCQETLGKNPLPC